MKENENDEAIRYMQKGQENTGTLIKLTCKIYENCLKINKDPENKNNTKKCLEELQACKQLINKRKDYQQALVYLIVRMKE